MIDLTANVVETWIKAVATGRFHYTKVLDGNVDKKAYPKLRKIIYDLCHAATPCVESEGKNDGYYRPIQELVSPVDFANVKAKTGFPIDLPFNLTKWAFIYPNTVIIVAGSKSSAKTGFLYRTVAMNLGKTNLKVFSNMEGGREQMWDRFMAMGINLTDYPDLVYPVSENYHDFIKDPNTIYVIDYIDAPEGTEFYIIGALIGKVRRKLNNSVAVIALQKPSFRDIPVGGQNTLKDATLSVALDKNKLKILDVKVPVDPHSSPNNKTWTFLLKPGSEGTDFDNVVESYGQGEELL